MHAQERIHWVLHKKDSTHKYGNQHEDARPQGPTYSLHLFYLIIDWMQTLNKSIVWNPLLEVILLLRRTAGKSSFPVGHSISLKDDPRLTGTIDEHTIAKNAAGFSLQRSRWMHNLGGSKDRTKANKQVGKRILWTTVLSQGTFHPTY